MDVPDLTGLTPATQLHIVQAYILLKLGGQLYSAIRSGGGLKRIISAVWFGENLPKPVAQDYKAELSKSPFPDSAQSTTPPGGS